MIMHQHSNLTTPSNTTGEDVIEKVSNDTGNSAPTVALAPRPEQQLISGAVL
jgi:hypothetical protein